MAEVETSTQQGQGDKIPEVVKEGLQSLAQPTSAPAPSPRWETPMLGIAVPGSEVAPPPPPAQGWASAGWTEEIEETLKGSSLKEEHRALIGAALQGFWSAGAGLHEVFKGFIMSFEVLFYPYANIIFLVYFVNACMCPRIYSHGLLNVMVSE